MSAPIPVLQVRNLCLGWPGQPLFQDLSFDLPPGLSLVTGDDGCGKSTLLRLLAGERPADSGTLQLNGRALSPTYSDWRSDVFWIDPQTQANDDISANRFFESLRLRHPRCSPEALSELAEGFGLNAHREKPMYMLSTGSKRKVWLTAAFAAGAALTLIDQPFAALDGPALRFLRELLQDVADHPSRAWLIADHAAPDGIPLAQTVLLSQPGSS